MKVQRINTSNNTSMNGNIIIKNSFMRTISEAIKESNYFHNLSRNNDVVIRQSYILPRDEFLFKIKYSVLKENSFYDRMLDYLHLKPRKEYNKQYKSAEELLNMLKI